VRRCGPLRRIEIYNIREDNGENALRDWSIGGLKYPDQPFCGVGHDVAVNDFTTRPVRTDVVPNLGNNDGVVYTRFNEATR
jgi:hypothetical protein